MKRRAFFGGLLGAGAAAATASTAAFGKPLQGVWWTPECPMKKSWYSDKPLCGWIGEPMFVDLTKAVHVPNQCPRCLSVIDLSGLAEQIKKYNQGRASRAL